MQPITDTMVRLDSLRLEPSVSATSTLVELGSIEREIAHLEASLATLIVRAATGDEQSDARIRDAWTTLTETKDADEVRRLLNIEVVELPAERQRWGAVVLEAVVGEHLQLPVLFYRAQGMSVTVPRSRALKLLAGTGEAIRAWLGSAPEQPAPAPAPAPGPAPAPVQLVARTEVDAPAAAGGGVAPAAAAARERRDELLKSEVWLSSTEVAKRARGGAVLESNPHQHASRLRREKRLFGVRLGGQYLHPGFQFTPATGEPHPALPDLLAKLPDEDHGWAAALWLFAPTGKLGGARPADVFQERPAEVIDAARRDFEGDNADW